MKQGQFLYPLKGIEQHQRPGKATQISWDMTKPTDCTVVHRSLMLEFKEELMTQS